MSANLQPAPEVLVQIPSTVAVHILGESAVVLGQGDLIVVSTKASEVSAPTSAFNPVNHTPLLTLTVGEAAFPLFKSTTFGTLADDLRSYVFTPEIGGEQGGFVKITLPDGVEDSRSPLAELQTQLEQLFIDHGLLKEGIETAADELGKNVRDDTHNVTQSVHGSSTSYLVNNPTTTSPASFSPATHPVMSSSASTTQSMASAARRLSGAFSSAAGQAGAWVSGHLIPTSSTASQNITSLSNAYDTATDGAVAGTTELQGSIRDATGQRVENAYGSEARVIAGNADASVENVSATMGDAAKVASGGAMVTSGLRGASSTQDRQELKESLNKRDEDVWNDVSI